MPSPRPAVARCKRTCHETPELVFTCDSEPIGLYEIERRLRTAGFKRPQAGSIMDAEQSDELAEAYEQGKQAVFDAMNHFDELAIVERANPYRKDGR